MLWLDIFPGMSAKKKTASRHGKLADTTGQTSITMNKELLAKCRSAARDEGRSLSNWLEQLAKKTLGYKPGDPPRK